MTKIIIDAGHGLHTAGKRCLKALDPNETREWVLNSKVAEYLQTYLSAQGIEWKRVDDITGAIDVSLSTRCRIANEWGADLYISIHHNAGVAGGNGGGTVCYKKDKVNNAITVALRDNIYNGIIAETGLKGNRSTPKTEANFQVLRETKMPACLIECGFMDSATDIKHILTDNFSDKCAKGIAEGAIKTLGKNWQESEVEPQPQPTPEPKPTPSNKITEDGKWGKGTTIRAQEVFGAVADGIVSNQYATYKAKNPGLLSQTFEWENKPGKNGSLLIKKIQEYIGIKADGFIGPSTIRAMQKWLGTPTDGVAGNPSMMVKAFQKWLNKQ